jgi:membrane-bound lytic murein transglycosylase A
MVRRQNRQVVFFRIVGLNDDTEAVGAQGIPLTAGRSIAVDRPYTPGRRFSSKPIYR